MPDDEQVPEHEPRGGGVHGVFTGFGVASAVLGVVALIAVVLAAMVWSGHRDKTAELRYRTQVLQAAADWTGVLINMNKDTVDADMTKLHEGTVGQLNADFETSVEPFRRLVQTLQSTTTGQVDSVAIETIHHDQPGAQPPPEADLAGFSSRTDTVMVIATSLSENSGTEEPQTVRWTLRLDVTDVDGKLLISRLEPIR
ncbi:hypothetical protein [Mycolicibacterium iranicum]|uniref:hypothetical protein n=1 Tax=Mycolicibacterium iranicum TaxID=912594 RepID=UPI0004666B91|nr:hypothetical protein [Mycolicibacterium iranicum]